MAASPRHPSELGPSFFTRALAGSFPGATVAKAELVEMVDGTNRRARFRLEYERGDGPASVFVKAPGRLLNRLALSVLGALDTEAELALSGTKLPLEHAELLAGLPGRGLDGSFVVLEDIAGRGGVPNRPREALGPAQVASGLAELAKLHARYLEGPLPRGLSFVSPWRLGAIWAAVSGPSLLRARRRLERLGSTAWPAGAGFGLLERQFRSSAELAGRAPLTVLHGDPHIGNSYSLPGDRIGFYDWQLLRLGHLSHDVSYFLVGSLTVEDRRDQERELLAGYLEALAAAGARPPTFAEVWERHRAGPAFGLVTWLHTLSARSFQEDEDCLAMIERYAAAYEDLETARAL